MRNRALNLLDEEQRERVRRAVARLEKRTSCEVVAALVDSCRDYAAAPFQGGLVLAATYFICAPALYFFDGQLYVYALGGALAYAAGYALTAGCRPLRRFFVGRPARAVAAAEKAEALFWRKGLQRTAGRNGILLAGFLFERQALVYGDENINRHLRQEDWDEALRRLIAGLSTGEAEPIAAAYVAALEHLEGRLAEQFPIQPDDVNELPDALLVE